MILADEAADRRNLRHAGHRGVERQARQEEKQRRARAARKRELVFRLPRLRLAFPNLLDRYVVRLFWLVFLLVVLSGLSLFIVFDLGENIDEIFKNNVPKLLVFNYYKYASLQMFYEIAPVVVLVTTLIGLNWLVGVASARNRTMERLVAGEAVLLARDGEAYARVLRRHHISDSEFQEALHEAGCKAVDEVRQAVLEPVGRISIVKKQPGGDPPPDAKEFEGKPGKFDLYFSPEPGEGD